MSLRVVIFPSLPLPFFYSVIFLSSLYALHFSLFLSSSLLPSLLTGISPHPPLLPQFSPCLPSLSLPFILYPLLIRSLTFRLFPLSFFFNALFLFQSCSYPLFFPYLDTSCFSSLLHPPNSLTVSLFLQLSHHLLASLFAFPLYFFPTRRIIIKICMYK